MRSSISSSRLFSARPLRIAAATGAILLAYNLAIALIKPDVALNFDSGLRNQIEAERYLVEATPRAVLTGSSMGFRLSRDFMEGDYLGPDIFNLSLAGKTALPGLDIILAKPDLPRIVFVEMNTMDRGYDGDFAAGRLQEPWRWLRTHLPGFRVQNRPFDLAVVLTWKALKGALNRAGMVASERVFSAPAGESASGPPVSDQLRAAVDANMGLLDLRIASLRAGGVRVVLLRMPSHPAAETAGTLYMWDACYSHFAQGRYEWLDLRSTGSYQTEDGLHLNKSSARLAATVLRRFVDQAAVN